MAASMDDDWLINKASFAEAAAVWRTATVYAAGGDPVAERATQLAEERLHTIRPDLMNAYTRHRQAGMPVSEAMRAAAREVWENDARTHHGPGPAARPHDNTRHRAAITPQGPKALPAGRPGTVDGLDAAVRVEAARLAEHIRPEVLDELQRRWRATGRLPAGDPVQLLRDLAVEVREGASVGGLDGHTVEAFRASAAGIDDAIDRMAEPHAGTARGHGRQQSESTDGAATAVDAHAAGHRDGETHDGPADRLPRDAAAAGSGDVGLVPAWAQAFPRLRVAQVDPVMAGKRSAQAVTASQHRGRGR